MPFGTSGLNLDKYRHAVITALNKNVAAVAVVNVGQMLTFHYIFRKSQKIGVQNG